jgi:UDPglucose 6-dehydrogenase
MVSWDTMVTSVGVVGLGRLGLPVAVALALRGYDVVGSDLDPARMSWSVLSSQERGPSGSGSLVSSVDETLPLRFTGLTELLAEVECVLVAVETPHESDYEGITPLPVMRADFGYDALATAVGDIARLSLRHMEIGVVSTVLPGTMRGRILPLAGRHRLVYCPFFVGMGTVAADLSNPEFILLGGDDPGDSKVADLLTGLAPAPVFRVSYETAELAKVLYNTFVSAKVSLANLTQRMSHEVRADAGDVLAILRAGDRRLLSGAYLAPGMGDGGPCHPRDNIALSWLARRHGVESDLFSAVMETRQDYVAWIGGLLVRLAGDRQTIVLGTAFKPGTDLTTGSSTVLMLDLLRRNGVHPIVVERPAELATAGLPASPSAYFIGCPEPEFLEHPFPSGSLVLDPWHRVPADDDLDVVWPGAGPGKP